MISGSSIISLLVTLVVLGLVFYLVVWLLDWIGVPAPFDKIIKVIIGLFVFIYLLNILFGLSGHHLFRYP